MPKGKLKRISSSIPMELLKGKDGVDGRDGVGSKGERGAPGKDGLPGVGIPGRDGSEGKSGSSGLAPAHEISNGEVRFQNPDGTWGEWIKFASSGGGGKISTNTYVSITTAEYHINKNQLDLGMNIFGVNFAGDVTIYLPQKIDTRSHIIINDESASAATNNITIQVET